MLSLAIGAFTGGQLIKRNKPPAVLLLISLFGLCFCYSALWASVTMPRASSFLPIVAIQGLLVGIPSSCLLTMLLGYSEGKGELVSTRLLPPSRSVSILFNLHSTTLAHFSCTY